MKKTNIPTTETPEKLSPAGLLRYPINQAMTAIDVASLRYTDKPSSNDPHGNSYNPIRSSMQI